MSERFQFTCHLPLAAQCPTDRGRTTCGVIHRTRKKALAHARTLNATVMERWKGTRLGWHTLGYLSDAGGGEASAAQERAPAGHVDIDATLSQLTDHQVAQMVVMFSSFDDIHLQAAGVAPVDALGQALGGLARQVLQQRLGVAGAEAVVEAEKQRRPTPLTNR